MEDKETYTKAELLEAIRQVLFTGTPDLYDRGGVLGTINMRPNHTTIRAKEAFEKYCLKNNKLLCT